MIDVVYKISTLSSDIHLLNLFGNICIAVENILSFETDFACAINESNFKLQTL